MSFSKMNKDLVLNNLTVTTGQQIPIVNSLPNINGPGNLVALRNTTGVDLYLSSANSWKLVGSGGGISTVNTESPITGDGSLLNPVGLIPGINTGDVLIWNGADWVVGPNAGSVGPQGVAGTDGSVGPQGVAGTDGSVGPQGVAGTDGSVGPQGDVGPQGPINCCGLDQVLTVNNDADEQEIVGVERVVFAGGNGNVRLGTDAGLLLNGNGAIAIGLDAGKSNQGLEGIAIGAFAGEINQGEKTVAIGVLAGKTSQLNNAIAIGHLAGETSQGSNSVAIGNEAAKSGQGNYCVAIGHEAGIGNQGTYSVAIGHKAGSETQEANTIVINATDNNLPAEEPNALYVKPIRVELNLVGKRILYWDEDTGEITVGEMIPPP